MKKLSRTLIVSLNDATVGMLKKNANGAISFKYSPEWIDINFSISNSLPIREDEYRGEVVSRYFDNLLPDNNEIKKTIANKFGAESIRPFDILSVIGRDCVGALSFYPESELSQNNNKKLDCSPLSEAQIAHKIKELGKRLPLGMDQGNFRLSIAGAQEKTALLKIKDRWYEPHGKTPTTHIIKKCIGALGLDINFSDSIDNEWASLFLLRKFGIKTATTAIEQFNEERVLVIERFDRFWYEDELLRRPQEDFCQVFGISPYKKYENEGGIGIRQISDFLKRSKDERDRSDFFKTIILFDLLWAPDGHAKNFSIFLEDDGFRLTPIYDVMGGYFLYKREKMPLKKMKLAMKVGKSNHYSLSKIALRHYRESFQLCGLSPDDFDQIIDEVKRDYEKFDYKKSEIGKSLNIETLDIILEGMTIRYKKLFG